MGPFCTVDATASEPVLPAPEKNVSVLEKTAEYWPVLIFSMVNRLNEIGEIIFKYILLYYYFYYINIIKYIFNCYISLKLRTVINLCRMVHLL